MTKGKANTKFDFNKKTCEYENGTWCDLPKYKRCEHVLRCKDGSKACGITSL